MKRVEYYCKHCKTTFYFPLDLIDTYCEFCSARGKRKKLKKVEEIKE